MDFHWTPEQKQLREKVIQVGDRALKEGEAGGEKQIVKILAAEALSVTFLPRNTGAC